MIALKITAPGRFMSALLSGTAFDGFLLQEASLKLSVVWQIDGRLVRDYFDDDEWEDLKGGTQNLASWSRVRPHLHSLIRGKKPPASLSFILQAPPSYMDRLFREAGLDPEKAPISACILNIRFTPSDLRVMTGTAWKTFSPDRTPETLWDRDLMAFLSARNIDFEKLV